MTYSCLPCDVIDSCLSCHVIFIMFVMSCHLHACHVVTYSCLQFHVIFMFAMSCHIHVCHVMAFSCLSCCDIFMFAMSCHIHVCHVMSYSRQTQGPKKTVRIRRSVSCSLQSQWGVTSPSQAWLSHPCPTSWTLPGAWLQPAPLQLLWHPHQLP